MNFEQFLNERIVNLFVKDTDEREKYKDVVYDLIQKAYDELGGFKGSGFKNAGDMLNSIPMWKLARKDGNIVAGLMYKDKAGRKTVCIFTDKTEVGKEALKDLLKHDFERSYTELSSKALRFVNGLFGVDYLLKYVIPLENMKVLLDGDELSDGDDSYKKLYPKLKDYFYSRDIRGHKETKVAFGTSSIKIK